MYPDELEIFDITQKAASRENWTHGIGLNGGSGETSSTADCTLVSAAGAAQKNGVQLLPYLGFAAVFNVAGAADERISADEVRSQLNRFPSNAFDLTQEDAAGGSIPRRLLLRTGWDAQLGTPYRILSGDALDVLLEQKPILLGIDAPSFDAPGERGIANKIEQSGICRMLNLQFTESWDRLEEIGFSELLMLSCAPLKLSADANLLPARALLIRKP